MDKIYASSLFSVWMINTRQNYLAEKIIQSLLEILNMNYNKNFDI